MNLKRRLYVGKGLIAEVEELLKKHNIPYTTDDLDNFVRINLTVNIIQIFVLNHEIKKLEAIVI